MFNPAALRALILTTLDATPFPDLERAAALLLGTAAQESHLTHWRQLGGGPARGIFQMEWATARDHWSWLRSRPWLLNIFTQRTGRDMLTPLILEHNIIVQIWLARIHYYVRDPLRMPEEDDTQEQARRWKRYYNTVHGFGTEEQYIRSWNRLVQPHIS